jgi:hypothetical protein
VNVDDPPDKDNYGATAASLMAYAKVTIDTSLSAWAVNESKISVRVKGDTYKGKCVGYDGDRIIIEDDVKNSIVVYLSSGVAVLGPRE